MKKKELKSIEIIFENCEYITIPRKYIGMLQMRDIKRGIYRHAINSITEQNVITDFAIELSRDIKSETYSRFGDNEQQYSVYNRLNEYLNITGIDVIWNVYDENDVVRTETETLLVRWGDDEYTNEYEKIYESKLGNLYIVISETEAVETMFDVDRINVDDYFGIIKAVDDECV